MLLFISGSTILLSLLLAIYNWRINRNSIFLSLCFIVISLYTIAHHFTVYGRDEFWMAIFYNHFASLSFLAGPFLFFYIRGTLSDRYILTTSDLIHFIPFTLHFIGIIPYLMMPFNEKKAIAASIIENLDNIKQVNTNFIFSVSTAFTARPVILAGYVSYSAYLLFTFSPYSSKNVNIPKKQFFVTYRWLIILLTSLLLLSISFLLVSFQFITTNASHTLSNSGRLYYLTGVVLGFMALMLLFFPQVLYGLPSYVKTDENVVKGAEKVDLTATEIEKVFTSLDSFEHNDEPFIELAERLQAYLINQKPFLHPDFSIDDVAKALGVPLNHITYCLNYVMHVKFTALRMRLRIEYAKHLLKDGKTNQMTIEGIAQQAGFSTRSSFYNAFKAETGLTPTEFLKKEE